MYVNRKVLRYQKIIRWFKSNKSGQYNDQKKKTKKNDDLQNAFCFVIDFSFRLEM